MHNYYMYKQLAPVFEEPVSARVHFKCVMKYCIPYKCISLTVLQVYNVPVQTPAAEMCVWGSELL